MAKENQEDKTEEKQESVPEKDVPYFVGRVPTQFEPVIVDRETNAQLTSHEALAKIMCDVHTILRSLR